PGRRLFLETKRQKLRIRLSFLTRWLLTYAVASALGVHVKINTQREADFRAFARHVQAREDWIVLFVSSIWMVLLLIIFLFPILSYLNVDIVNAARFSAWFILFALVLIQSSAVGFGLDILTKKSPSRSVDKIAPYALLFL